MRTVTKKSTTRQASLQQPHGCSTNMCVQARLNLSLLRVPGLCTLLPARDCAAWPCQLAPPMSAMSCSDPERTENRIQRLQEPSDTRVVLSRGPAPLVQAMRFPTSQGSECAAPLDQNSSRSDGALCRTPGRSHIRWTSHIRWQKSNGPRSHHFISFHVRHQTSD